MNPPFNPRNVGDLLSWAAQVNDYLRAITPRGNVVQGVQGFTIPQSRGDTKVINSARRVPWRVYRSASTETTVSFKVTPGLVNGVIPTDWSDALTIPNDETRYLSLTVSVSSGQVSSVAYAMTTSPVAPPNVLAGAPPVSFSIPLAMIVNAKVFPLCQYRNFLATVQEVYRAPKVVLNAGDYPLDIYYTWSITQP